MTTKVNTAVTVLLVVLVVLFGIKASGEALQFVQRVACAG